MSKLSAVTTIQVISVLEKLDFSIVRQKGSHVRLKHEDGRVVTVPVHSGQTIGKGLLHKILRDVNLTKDEFITLLD
jgi:predicted RNA binding protein YcfA (HicA-like mRNA interferase family)